MTLKQRRLALGATIATVLALMLTGLPANADNTDNYFASPGTLNSSDPYTYRCNQYGVPGWCMVTSQDMNRAPYYPDDSTRENYYPMDRTLMRFSKDGLAWSAPTVVLDEAVMTYRTGKVANADHVWAPAVRRVGLDTDNYGNQYLYVPALTDANKRLSSRIFTTFWNGNPTYNPFYNPPGFSYQPGDPGIHEVTGAPAGLYMSDPDVFSDAVNWQTDTSKDYLLWADGDAGSCGGLSMRKMRNWREIEPFSNAADAQVKVTGFPSSWNCTPAGSANPHPYFEGASLYNMSNFRWTSLEGKPAQKYTMIFAVKPKSTPSECSTANGEPGTNKEAIAYATATNVTGPYAYQGIIMCGSSTEWTNQASLMEVQASNGDFRLVLVHHDGKATPYDTTPRTRQLHAECLYTVNGKFIKTMRSTDGIASTSGSPAWCLREPNIRALKSVSNGKYITSRSTGLKAGATFIGPWEQLSMRQPATGLELNWRQNGQYLRSLSDGKLVADRTVVGEWERYTPQAVSGKADTFRFRDYQGRYFQVQSDGSIKATSKTPAATDTTFQFLVEYLSK
jgi:hypothetical protein